MKPNQTDKRRRAEAVELSHGLPVASWVIRNKRTGEVIMETYSKKVVSILNTTKYEAVPVQQHLVEVNTLGTLAYKVARRVRVRGNKLI